MLAAALVGALTAAYWQPAGAAQMFEVRVGDTVQGRYSLDRPQRIEVRGPLGVSVLEVREHRVRFIESPCRNKVCIHSGWLAHSGDATACLPNRVSVSLYGGDQAIDAVAQ